jgi:hypothetical protein
MEKGTPVRQPENLTEDIIGMIGKGIHEAPETSPPNPSPSIHGGKPAPNIIGETYSRSIEDAANVLLSLLDPALRDLVEETAESTLHIPRWQLILGSLMAQYESGALVSPSLDPSWRNVEMALKKNICEECGGEFTPKRFGQRYCADQTPRCGDVARKRVIEEKKKTDQIELERTQRETIQFKNRYKVA